MADELKPYQDGEQETDAAAEVLPDTAEADAASAEDEMQKAFDAIDNMLAEDESGEAAEAGPDGDAAWDDAAAEETPTGPSKAEVLKEKAKEKASLFAGKVKDGAGKLSDKIKQSNAATAKKRGAKRLAAQPSLEEELADLAEEEKQFDEWGRPIRRKRRRRRKKSRKLSCTLVLLTSILAMSSVLSVAILAVVKEMYGIDKDVQERIIEIPEGSTTQSIADQLVTERMISLPQVFRFVSRMNGKDGSYIAGEHVLSASMSYEAMIEELCTNKADERETQRVTIREGTTLVDAAKLLQENQIIDDAEQFIFYFNSGNFGFEFENHLSEKNSLKWQQMEGYCFPDTYEFYVGEEPNIVAQKIYANFNNHITEGDYRKMDELGMTLDEVITLASMVQGEASRIDYMKQVASVFHNRLLNKSVYPKLESDPTRKYAELIAENLEINNETMTTAYNTYQGTGLPPGAINNPGRQAIEAVLYPAQTSYFFFNSNINTGDTYFAETYEKHLENLAMVQGQYAAAEAAANGNG